MSDQKTKTTKSSFFSFKKTFTSNKSENKKQQQQQQPMKEDLNLMVSNGDINNNTINLNDNNKLLNNKLKPKLLSNGSVSKLIHPKVVSNKNQSTKTITTKIDKTPNGDVTKLNQVQLETGGLQKLETTKNWHMEHFNCIYCKVSLLNEEFVKYEDEDKPVCPKCYSQRHSHVCEECQMPIDVYSKDLSFKDRHWHEKCFICNQCKTDLYGKEFGYKTDRIFCSNCYDERFALRCCKCNEKLEIGQKKIHYQEKVWHATCFCCKKCLSPVYTMPFQPKGEDVYCSDCFTEIFATRCVKCCEIIKDDGITFRKEPWHATCFKCSNCSTELSSIPFKVGKNDQPFCKECYDDLFSLKCDHCKKPITGTTSSKMIRHENRQWHIQCFKCHDCNIELQNKGFHDEDNNIYCSTCTTENWAAKQRAAKEEEFNKQQDQHAIDDGSEV